jgi:subtilisin family serine protease
MAIGSIVSTPDRRAAGASAISRGMVVTAGNNGGQRTNLPYSYPAAFSGAISTTAVNANGHDASLSDHHTSVLASASGENAQGSGRGGQYVIDSGTSGAPAFVAERAALIRAESPMLTQALVTRAIVASTRHRPRIEAAPPLGTAALTPSTPPTPDRDGVGDPGHLNCN